MLRADIPTGTPSAWLSVEIPAGWTATTVAGPAGQGLAIVRDEATGSFNPNLVVFADPLSPAADLADWLEANLDPPGRAAGVDLNGDAGRESIGTVAGRPALFRLLHLTTQAAAPPTELDQTQLFVEVDAAAVSGSLVVQFLGTSPSTELEQNAATFNAIAHSLQVVAP